MAQPSNNPQVKNPGFTEAIFLKSDLVELLNRRKCDGIRFYNILRNKQVEVMAVSIACKADMKRWGWFSSKSPYYIAEGRTACKVKLKAAKAAAKALSESSVADFYSAHFEKEAIEFLLKPKEIDAIRLSPANNSTGHLSMKIEAFNTKAASGQQKSGNTKQKSEDEDDTQTVVFAISASSTGSFFISPTPCPPYCGYERDDYVFSPK